MIYYVYETKCTITNMIYVGVHGTENLQDGYLGSGFYFLRAVKKYGKNAFEKRILSFHNTFEDALLEEKRIVTLDFIRREDTYNLKEGGFGGQMGPEVLEKMKESAFQTWRDPLVRKKRSQASKLKWTEDYRKKVVESIKASYTQDLRNRKSKIMKEKAKDPEYIKHLSEGVSKSYEGEAGAILREKRTAANLKRWADPEARRRISEKMRHPQKKVVCPHCGKMGGISNMKRHHFDNCKEKKDGII